MAEARLTAIVSTKGAQKGSADLQKYSKSANDAERSTDRLARRTKSASAGFKSFGRNASASISAIDGPLGGISSRLSSLTTVLTSGTAAVTGLALAVTAFGAAVAIGVKELDKLNVASAKTEALLKATGFAVGFTAEQLNKQARDIALNTLASVEGIQQAQAVLLTFNRVQGDTSTRALKLSQDLATVFGGTAASQATQLGKALQDPTKGITALSRVGVTFTEVQKEQIRLFQEGGEAAKAQEIILRELTNQVGGAGGAVAAGTLAGAFDSAGQLFSEFTVALAKSTGAYDVTLNFIDRLNNGLKSITGLLDDNPLKDLVTAAERTAKIRDIEAEIAVLSEKAASQNARSKRITEARIEDRETELRLITDAIAAEEQVIVKREEAQKKSADIAAKQKEDDLRAIQDKLAKEEAIRVAKAKAVADQELAVILASNDTELEATNRKEQEKLALFQSFRDQDLISLQEYQAAKAEIEQTANDRRREIEAADFANREELRIRESEAQKAKFEEENALALETAQVASSAITNQFLAFAKGQQSAGEAVLNTIGAISESIFTSIAQQVIQQKITDRIIAAGFLQQKAAEVSASTAQAGLNAFVSTSGAPFPLNLTAPAAAAAATTTAGALGAGVIAAASAREQGGSLAAGQNSTFAERGQLEILTPASSSRVRTAQQMKGIMGESQSSPQVSIVVIDQAPGSKDFETSTDDEGRIVLLIRETVSADVSNANSQIRKSFANSTNLRSAGR